MSNEREARVQEPFMAVSIPPGMTARIREEVRRACGDDPAFSDATPEAFVLSCIAHCLEQEDKHLEFCHWQNALAELRESWSSMAMRDYVKPEPRTPGEATEDCPL